jgi:chromatin assembly factor 1 subunit A
VLSKSIRSQLLPEPIEVDAIAGTQLQSFENLLPLAAIESVVHSVAERVNYGLEQGQYGLTKPPAALCLWRWEVKDASILPSQFKDKAEERKLERKAARTQLRSLLDPLSPEMRASLLGVKGIPLSKESQSPAPLDTSKTVRHLYSESFPTI